jgi:hypothetical protein
MTARALPLLRFLKVTSDIDTATMLSQKIAAVVSAVSQV